MRRKHWTRTAAAWGREGTSTQPELPSQGTGLKPGLYVCVCVWWWWEGVPGERITEEPVGLLPLVLGFGFWGKAKGLVSWKWEPRPLLNSRTRRVASAQRERGLEASGWGPEKSKSEPGDVIDSGGDGGRGGRYRESPERQSTSQGVVTNKPKGSRGVLRGAQALVGLQYSERLVGGT